MSDLPPRGVIHEHEFEEQLARLIADPEQADEFIAGAETVLASDPESGMPCKAGGSIWYLPMSPVGNRPHILPILPQTEGLGNATYRGNSVSRRTAAQTQFG